MVAATRDSVQGCRDTMIYHGIHPFADEVTDTQVHVAFNQIYQEVIYRLKNDF